MRINDTEVPVSRATVIELSEIVRAMNEAARNDSMTPSSKPDLPLAEQPTEEEVRALLDALEEANVAAQRVLTVMDRTHEEMQGLIGDLRRTREMLAEANAR